MKKWIWVPFVFIFTLLNLSFCFAAGNEYKEFRGIRLGDTYEQVRKNYPEIVKSTEGKIFQQGFDAFYINLKPPIRVAGFDVQPLLRLGFFDKRVGSIDFVFECHNEQVYQKLLTTLNTRYDDGIYYKTANGNVSWRSGKYIVVLEPPEGENCECLFYIMDLHMWGRAVENKANKGW